MFIDTTASCRECGQPFPFTAARQQEYAERHFPDQPQRCPACLRLHRASGNVHEPHAGRPLRPARCAGCGGETWISFVPRHGKAIYCPDCFQR